MKKFFKSLILVILLALVGLCIAYICQPSLFDGWFGKTQEQPVEPDNPDTEEPGETNEPTEDDSDNEEDITYICNVADYEFDGNSITGYNGTDSNIQLPISYSIAGTEIVEQTFAEEFEIIDYLMQNFETIEYPLTIKDANNQEYLISSEMDIMENHEIIYPVSLEIEKFNYVEGNDYQVTNINDYAFENCSNLKSIKISEGITNIGAFAFISCSNLTYVEIPNSVNNIEDKIFLNCLSLKEINVASGNTNYISVNGVLYDYNMTTLIKYPAIKDGDNYIIPDSVTNIESFAFEYCNNLTSIKISKNLTSMGAAAFSSCKNLENIDFNNCLSLTKISSTTFIDCESLKSISLPVSITEIEQASFQSCTSLTNITIPSNVTKIGGSVFVGCKNLVEIIFLSETPPTITSTTLLSAIQTIKVPNESVEVYKSAQNFLNHADKIVGINA